MKGNEKYQLLVFIKFRELLYLRDKMIVMKNIGYLMALGVLVFGSCKKEVVATPEGPTLPSQGVILPPTTAQTAPNASQQNAQLPAGANANSIMYAQPTGGGSTANATTGQTYTTTTMAVPAKTAKGMNPPHGQPNHRCDIAVGAPLNSPPGKVPVPATPAPTVVTTPQVNTPAVATTTAVTPAAPTGATTAVPNLLATSVATAPGMNPPHGQEGHVCSVAVGAPLPK
jgi:hypothetical protein